MRGNLDWKPLAEHPELVAGPVRDAGIDLNGAEVVAIDPELADTAAFCLAYQTPLENSANCVIVAGRRGDVTRYAAVMVLASSRADVNGVIRKRLDARKCSFAPMDEACALTQMEYGGITPVGIPAGWPVLVDDQVIAAGTVIVGSGLRSSKMLLPAAELLRLPDAEQLQLTI